MRIQYERAIVGVAGVLLACLLAAGCGGTKAGGEAKPAGMGAPQGPPPEVAVYVVKPERVAITTELAGRTAPCLMAEVRPQVGGIVQKRLFNEGADVKEGDVLYQIDPATLQAAFDNAQAALARAEANLTPLGSRSKRYSELLAAKALSQQEYDDAAAAVKQAEAEIGSARAALETARINLDHTRVTAPISGRIGKSTVTVGALVMASQPAALATIQQLDPIYVDVTQSSVNLLRLRQKMTDGLIQRDGANQAKVQLVLEDGTRYPLEGTLQFSDVTVDPATGSVGLRTVFPNPDHTLLPGMYARAILEEGVNEQALLVSQQGVTRDPRGNAVALVVGEGDKVEPRTLKVDRAIGEKWLVSEGLKPGDRVIMEGTQKARPGSVVTAVPYAPEALPAADASAAPQTAAAK
jgi:membrane fusion protein (multidrug efflux system)